MKEYLIYAKTGCEYCDKLYTELLHHDIKFTFIVLHKAPKDIQNLKDKYYWQTMPIVIELEGEPDELKGTLIGGCEDTIKHLRSGSA